MRRLDHSIHAARFFFAIALLVGGSLAMGHLLDSNRGTLIGFSVGLFLFTGWLAWLKAARNRGNAWVQAGRDLGLRSMYSGHAPTIPIPGHEHPMELLSGTIGTATVLIGDRGERYLQYHTEAPVGTWETGTGSPEVSDPNPVEVDPGTGRSSIPHWQTPEPVGGPQNPAERSVRRGPRVMGPGASRMAHRRPGRLHHPQPTEPLGPHQPTVPLDCYGSVHGRNP